MFVRKKRAGTRVYHYLVRAERVNGKVHQRHILYLGKHSSLQAAIDSCRATITRLKRDAFEMRAACLELPLEHRRDKWKDDLNFSQFERPQGSSF